MVKEDKVQVTLLVDSRKAVNELGKLELEAREAKEAMRGLKKNSDEFNAASDKFKEATAKVEALRKSLGTAGMSMQQLKNYQAQLNREIGREIKGGDRWVELRGRIQEVSRALSDQRNELAGTTSLWSKISTEGKAFALASLAMLGIQELLAQVTNLIRGLSDLSDSMADVQKTTGLTAAEVEQLNNELKKIDTRSSRKELLELASIAGKLGVSGKENVLGFVKAADMLNVALGSDFGNNAEEVIKQVGKLVDIFKIDDAFGLEQGMLKVGSVINSLGAASSAAEGYLVEFTKRLGGIAPAAKLSSADVLAIGATLDQLGITAEVGSTAVGQFIMRIGKDMPKFAKMANMELKDFSDLLRRDANGALIVLLKAMQATGQGVEGMAKTFEGLNIDGAQAAMAIGVLTQNVALLERQQKLAREEFESGNSILKEFEVKNNNLAASVEKLQKRIAGAFINSSMMKGLEDIIKFLDRATSGAEDFSKGLREQEAQLRRTSIEMNASLDALRTANLTTEQRRDLIAQVNEKYKEYLPFLLTEKSGIEEIARVQQDANKAMMQKILLAQQDADMMERKGKIVALELEIQRKLALQVQKQIDMRKAAAERRFNAVGFIEAEINELQRGIDARRREVEQIQQSISSEQELYDAVVKRLALGEQANETPAQRLERLKKEYELEKLKLNEMTKQASLLSATAKFEYEKDAAFQAWEEVKAKKQALELRLKSIEALQQEISLAGSAAPKGNGLNAGGAKASIAQASSQQEMENYLLKWQEFQQKILKIEDERQLLQQEGYAKEFAEIDRKYEALLNEADTFRGKDRVSVQEYLNTVALLTERHGLEIVAKAKEINERLVADNKDKNERRLKDDMEFWASEADARAKADKELEEQRQRELQSQVQYYSQLGSLLSEFSTLMTATNSLIAAMGEEQGEFQKQLALFNIGIEMAASIAKATSAAMSAGLMTGAAAPFTTPIFIAQLTGIVVGSFAKAYALLNSDAPHAPSFYYGGFSGDGPAVDYDQYGKIVGGVHAKEYVVPSSLLFGNPWVANQVAIIEAMRVGRISEPPQMPGPASDTQGDAMQAMLARFDRMEARLERAILSLDKPSKAYFARDEAEAMQKYFGQQADNRKKSTL